MPFKCNLHRYNTVAVDDVKEAEGKKEEEGKTVRGGEGETLAVR